MADPHRLAEAVRRDLADTRWPSPAQIRARGRRRTMRQVAAAPVAVAVLLLGGWVAVGQWPVAVSPGNSQWSFPTGSPSPLPGPNGIGPDALLGAADLGDGFRVINEHTETGPGRAWLFDLSGRCPGYEALVPAARADFLAARGNIVERAVANANGIDSVHEHVARYGPGQATAVVADIARIVGACAEFTESGGEASSPEREAVTTNTWELIETNFAGTESLLIRNRLRFTIKGTATPAADDVVVAYVVIRVDDLVAVLSEQEGRSERLRTVAPIAAQRLCAATTAC